MAERIFPDYGKRPEAHTHPISHPGQERSFGTAFSFSATTWTYANADTLVKDNGGVTWDSTGHRWTLHDQGWWHCSALLNVSNGGTRAIARVLVNGGAGGATSQERSRLEIDPSALTDAFIILSCVFHVDPADKVGVSVWSNEASPSILADSRLAIVKVG